YTYNSVFLDGVNSSVFLNITNGDCVLPPMAVQTNICFVAQDNQPFSFIKAFLSNIPPGYSISNGAWTGWCVDYAGGLTTNIPYCDIKLIPSLDPFLPPKYANPNWDLVNYLLNHKQGNGVDIQAAIWQFIGGPINPMDTHYLPLSPLALSMVADAAANGEGFVPGPGQFSAIII